MWLIFIIFLIKTKIQHLNHNTYFIYNRVLLCRHVCINTTHEVTFLINKEFECQHWFLHLIFQMIDNQCNVLNLSCDLKCTKTDHNVNINWWCLLRGSTCSVIRTVINKITKFILFSKKFVLIFLNNTSSIAT